MARILVVDDTPQNLTLIQLYLRGTEFEVETAASGDEAIERCMQRSYDLILLDVVMPGMDGFEVCRRLKNDTRTAFVPVIFLTGRLTDESEKLAAYRLGAVDYIQKPVNREELVARIHVMLRLEGARSRLDRENAMLRQELERVQQTLGDAAESLRELERLRQQWALLPEDLVLVVDAGLRLRFADAGLAASFGALAPGEPLAAAGHAAARLGRLVLDGARAADLTVPEADGARCFVVRVRELGDGDRVVLLRDVTAVRAIEGQIVAREAVELPPPVVSAAAAYRMLDFVGESAAVRELSERVAMLRQTRSTVLIYGESGTGKELVARALHFDGQNRHAPFIPLHCGAIAPELVESELFGHEKGAFTGAERARDGLFKVADGGTIFLDEIAETSLSVQVKLLRVLQRGEIRPVGASQSRIVDVRIIAATNRNLLEMVRQGTFREDLYYRLDVVSLRLPPLRERRDDLPRLVAHFIDVCNGKHGRRDRPVRSVSRAAMERLLAYPWPGNVRELENVIERAFALGVGEVLHEDDLTPQVVLGQPMLGLSPVFRSEEARPTAATVVPAPADMRSQREAAERAAIQRAMLDCANDKAAAAASLGMPRSTFYRRLKELGL
ncbi:MAG: sigma-54-dependent Fis family transcriptional regulator [Planctomycetes bacterium]|nr:sigma-54-dependent Fis family transcriptional regulator [Planctomycetota bacterium]